MWRDTGEMTDEGRQRAGEGHFYSGGARRAGLTRAQQKFWNVAWCGLDHLIEVIACFADLVRTYVVHMYFENAGNARKWGLTGIGWYVCCLLTGPCWMHGSPVLGINVTLRWMLSSLYLKGPSVDVVWVIPQMED